MLNSNRHNRNNDEIAQKHARQLVKTEMCRFFLQGNCLKGRRCVYAHSLEEVRVKPNLNFTSICKAVQTTGICTNPQCKFAHSDSELKNTQGFFKTKMCNFAPSGRCKLGARCRFAHDARELDARAELPSTVPDISFPMVDNILEFHTNGTPTKSSGMYHDSTSNLFGDAEVPCGGFSRGTDISNDGFSRFSSDSTELPSGSFSRGDSGASESDCQSILGHDAPLAELLAQSRSAVALPFEAMKDYVGQFRDALCTDGLDPYSPAKIRLPARDGAGFLEDEARGNSNGRWVWVPNAAAEGLPEPASGNPPYPLSQQMPQGNFRQQSTDPPQLMRQGYSF